MTDYIEIQEWVELGRPKNTPFRIVRKTDVFQPESKEQIETEIKGICTLIYHYVKEYSAKIEFLKVHNLFGGYCSSYELAEGFTFNIFLETYPDNKKIQLFTSAIITT